VVFQIDYDEIELEKSVITSVQFSLLIIRPFSKSVFVKSINIIHNNKRNNKIIRQIRNSKDRKLRRDLTVIESNSHLCDKKKGNRTSLLCRELFFSYL